MRPQQTESELRERGNPSNKPQSGIGHQQIHAVGETSGPRPWWRRHGMKLCFLLGWILFPVWWIASFVGCAKRRVLKGWERAAWAGCIFFSLAGLIIFLILIIWYGVDPEGEKNKLLHRNTNAAAAVTQPTTNPDITLTKFGVKMSGACSDAKYSALVDSVQTAITADPSVAANANQLTFTKGQACYTTATRRHLLQTTVSNYEVLVKAKYGTPAATQQQLFTSVYALAAATGTQPPWCGSFCMDAANHVLSTSVTAGEGYTTCDKAASNGGAYTCTSGTLIASNYAMKNSPSDALCCTTCATTNLCIQGVNGTTARKGVTLTANQAPTFELCCNACSAITCGTLGAITPAPALDNSTAPNDPICCVQAPVVTPSMSMTLPAPGGCNSTSADLLAQGTQSSMVAGLTDVQKSTVDVKGTCTTPSRRRLHDATGTAFKLIFGVIGVKSADQALEATRVLCKAIGFNDTDIANATDVAGLTSKLAALAGNTAVLTTCLTKVEAGIALKLPGINITTNASVVGQTIKAVTVNSVCAGQPTQPGVEFPSTCVNSVIGADCSGSCKGGKVGMYTSTCGTDGKWPAPTGSCQSLNSGGTPVVMMNCTGNPKDVAHANNWTNCGQDKCTVKCSSGYMGSAVALCNHLTGNWSQPAGDCVLVKCPPPAMMASNPATNTATGWPSQCSLMGNGSSCNATCLAPPVGTPPIAMCALANDSNSASWTLTNGGKCFAETTCVDYTSNNASAICMMNTSAAYLKSSLPCYDPAAANIPVNHTACNADSCCRVAKRCNTTTPNITCSGSGSRFLPSLICGEGQGTPTCDAAGCCTQNTTCASSIGGTYLSCPANYTIKPNTPCGLGLDNPCNTTYCCAPPTCSILGSGGCGALKEPIPEVVCSTGVCNLTLCCRNKTCTGFSNCTAGALLRNSPASTTCTNGICDAAQCCSNATCSAYTCTNYTQGVPSTAPSTPCPGAAPGACNDTQCTCSVTCASGHFNASTCGSNQVLAGGNACPNGTCTNTTCCVPTCDSFSCTGAQSKTGSSGIACTSGTCDRSTCCDPVKCSTYSTDGAAKCTSPLVLISSAATLSCPLTGCTDSSCCVPICGTTSNICASGSTGASQKTGFATLPCDSGTCTASTCCNPATCGNPNPAVITCVSPRAVTAAAGTPCLVTGCDTSTCCSAS